MLLKNFTRNLILLLLEIHYSLILTLNLKSYNNDSNSEHNFDLNQIAIKCSFSIIFKLCGSPKN